MTEFSPLARHRTRRIIRFGVPLVLAGLAGAFFMQPGRGEQHAPDVPSPVMVAVVKPQSATVERYLQETGRVEATSSVAVVARATGRLASVDYTDGTEVKKGQTLFTIEADEYEAKVAQAEASVAQAKANLTKAERQYTRNNVLVKSSSVSQAAADEAETNRDSARAQLASAEAELKLAKINLGYTTITAPYDGYVTAHKIDVGALVEGQAGTELARVVTLDPVQVSFTISEMQLLRIRNNIKDRKTTRADLIRIQVEAATQIDEDFPLKGHLDYVAPETDPNTGTLSARAVFENGERALLPGMYVRIRIPMKPVEGALLVPASTIGTDQLGRYVLAVDPDGQVERRSVRLLQKTGDLQPVEGDLAATDMVVRNVLSGASAGQTVSPQLVTLPGNDDSRSASLNTVRIGG
ncbi:efflux RND transporter periplasmic adaptor subunit [uncultured Roseibium sp.]|uniref:efflux RND transporter periplasmic adaptor subunit n=1 Tax=uncultured Roseibium sp. TaxID=1936171 RepID=UPI003216D1AE